MTLVLYNENSFFRNGSWYLGFASAKKKNQNYDLHLDGHNLDAKSLTMPCITAGRMTSIHSAYIEEVHDVPISVITRPFIPELDEKKVQSLMETIQVSIE